jgi:hypothetical protein
MKPGKETPDGISVRSDNKTIGRAAASTPSMIPQLVRQLIIFPPDGIARRSGLVRERFMLFELASGAVYHLRVSCDWAPTPDRVNKLAEIIVGRESVCSSQEQTASFIGWALETSVRFVDMDLASPNTEAWPVRAAALERCCLASPDQYSRQPLAERVAFLQKEIADSYNASLMQFLKQLDTKILALSSLWGCMPWARYNYFASARDQRARTYRVQVAAAMPALVPVLSSEFGQPTQFSRTLSDVVDSGQPLINALAAACRVRIVTARHALTIPAGLVENDSVPTLTRALDSLVPERFPRALNEWNVFRRLVYDVIPRLTGRNYPASPINFCVLTAISRQGWPHAEQQLSHLFVNDADASLLREFLQAYRNSLAWDLMQDNSTTSRVAVQETCAEVVDETLAQVGILHIFEAARSFPMLLGQAKSELAPRNQLLRGERWNGVIEEAVSFEGCVIEPALTLAQLSRLATDLKNCLRSYAHACADGNAHIFSVCSVAGEHLGAAGFRFHVGRYGGFIIDCFDCKGPKNAPISDQGHRAVEALGAWLRTAEGQRRISAFRSTRVARYRGEKSDLSKRIAMEATIAALRRMRQKSLKFNTLREKVLRLLTAL